MGDDKITLASSQQDFCAYLRDPSCSIPAGMTVAQMQLYRTLFVNNIEDCIGRAFPVLNSIYSFDEWQNLLQGFIARHRCRSPLLVDMAAEFLAYIQFEHLPCPQDPPFLKELAHYEWLELDVSLSHESPEQKWLDKPPHNEQVLCLSSQARVVQYTYPVDKISADFLPNWPNEQGHYFCLYWDKAAQDNGQVCFLRLTQSSAQLLNCLSVSGRGTLSGLLQWMTEQGVKGELATLKAQLNDIVWQLATLGIIRTV